MDSTHAHPQDTPLADRAELRRRFVEAVHAASLMCDPGDPAQCGNGCDDLADAVLAIPELQRLREERDAWREASDADNEMHNEQRSRAEAAERKLAETYELLDQLIDDEPCRYDHHGYCQAHGWLHDGPCPVKRARHALAAREANGG